MTKEEIVVLGHAFFDGKTLQFNFESKGWLDWVQSRCPDFGANNNEWRIKPEEPKKEIWCTFKSESGSTCVCVKDSEDYLMSVTGGYWSHLPSLDREVELP